MSCVDSLSRGALQFSEADSLRVGDLRLSQSVDLEPDVIVSTFSSKKIWKIHQDGALFRFSKCSALMQEHSHESNYCMEREPLNQGLTTDIYRLTPKNREKKAKVVRVANADKQSADELRQGYHNLKRLHTLDDGSFVKHIPGLVGCYKGLLELPGKGLCAVMNEYNGNLRKAFSLPMAKKVEMMMQLASGLKHCHAMKFHLGDIKLNNVLFLEIDGSVYAVLNDVDGGRFLKDKGALQLSFLHTENCMHIDDLSLMEKLNPQAFSDEDSDDEDFSSSEHKKTSEEYFSDNEISSRSFSFEFDENYSETEQLGFSDDELELEDSDSIAQNSDELQISLSLAMDVFALGLVFKSLVMGKGFESQEPITPVEAKAHSIPAEIVGIVNQMLTSRWSGRSSAEKIASDLTKYISSSEIKV